MTTKGFLIIGLAAHERIEEWDDLSPYAATTTNSTQSHEPSNDVIETTDNSSLSNNNGIPIEFLCENSPRHTTKGIRDKVSVYSHLPNGTSSVLDDSVGSFVGLFFIRF